VSGDADNWLEQIAQIVSNVEIEIPVNGDRLLQFYNRKYSIRCLNLRF
jgi:hypothetical protein